MGLVYADIEIIRVADMVLAQEGYLPEAKVRRINVKALVDSGAYMLCINESIRDQLDLRKLNTMDAEMADGRLEKVDVVGPVEVRFLNRRATVDAVVLPGEVEVLLGAIPMEDLDVVINPKEQTLEVNPNAPYIAKKKIK